MGGGETATDPGALPRVPPLEVWLSERGFPGTTTTRGEPASEGHSPPVGVLGLFGKYLYSKGIKVFGGILAIGGAIWEGFHAGVWLRELIDAPDPREVRRDAWRRYMDKTLWLPYYQEIAGAAREAAFDDLVGDHASHGVVPKLTEEALAASRTLENEISDRWLGHLCVIKALEEYIEKGPHTGMVTVPDHPDAPPGGGYAVDLSRESRTEAQAVEAARAEIERLKNSMADDLKALVEFQNDPANWALTPEQQAVLPVSR